MWVFEMWLNVKIVMIFYMMIFMICIIRYSGRFIKEFYVICDSFIVVYVRRIVWIIVRYFWWFKFFFFVWFFLLVGGVRKSDVDEFYENFLKFVEEFYDDDFL